MNLFSLLGLAKKKQDNNLPKTRVQIGIDFGTSITKVCYRFNDRSTVLIFKSINKSLFYSKIYFDPQNRIFMPLERKPENTVEIDYIKMRLARNIIINQYPSAHWLVENSKLTFKQIAGFCNLDLSIIQKIADGKIDNPEPDYNPTQKDSGCINKSELKAAEKDDAKTLEGEFFMPFKKIDNKYDINVLVLYFLAKVIQEAKISILQNNNISNPEWWCSVGIPFDYTNKRIDSQINQTFKIAMLLSDQNIPNQYEEIKKFYEQGKNTDLSKVKCEYFPEIAAAICAYFFSFLFKDGMHLYFDIGGGTVDVVAFSFDRTDEGNQVKFISGIVKPYGIQAIANDLSPDNVSDFANNLYKSSIDIDETFNFYKGKIHNLVKSLIISVCKIDRSFFEKYEKDMFNSSLGIPIRSRSDMIMPIFAGGGGCKSQFYVDTIDESHEQAKLYQWSVPPFKIRKIPPPSDEELELFKKSFFRYTIAYGLSFPKWERPEIDFPKEKFYTEKENTIDSKIPDKPDYYE